MCLSMQLPCSIAVRTGVSKVPTFCCRIDVSTLEPLVAAPHSPDNRKTARECAATAIDRVYIG